MADGRDDIEISGNLEGCQFLDHEGTKVQNIDAVQMNDGVQVRTAYAGNEGTPAKPLDAAQKIKLKAKGGDKEVALATFPLPGTGELTEEIVRAHGVVLMTGS